MTISRRDTAATALTVLVVLVFAAAHEGWDVWLVGVLGHRAAAAVILVLGAAITALLSHAGPTETTVLDGVGVVAAALGVLALVTGSLTPLSLLAVAVVVLWAVGEWPRSGRSTPHRPAPA